MNREAIYAAVWAAVSTNTAVAEQVVTKGRLLKPFTTLKPEQCPALFMVQQGETAVHMPGLPIKWTLNVEFVLYLDAINDLSSLPATQANVIMDAIEASLHPRNPANVHTLGRLVEHCSIKGQILTDEGLMGPKAIWVVPVSILVP